MWVIYSLSPAFRPSCRRLNARALVPTLVPPSKLLQKLALQSETLPRRRGHHCAGTVASMTTLAEVAALLVAPGKGILASDESTGASKSAYGWARSYYVPASVCSVARNQHACGQQGAGSALSSNGRSLQASIALDSSQIPTLDDAREESYSLIQRAELHMYAFSCSQGIRKPLTAYLPPGQVPWASGWPRQAWTTPRLTGGNTGSCSTRRPASAHTSGAAASGTWRHSMARQRRNPPSRGHKNCLRIRLHCSSGRHK